VFDNNRVSFQDRLYNLFTNYNNYTRFATEAWTHEIANADSLESLHDAIHSIVGSNGHMTYLDYSAYDPSFFLHHAMVDRIFALWQKLYPNSYVEPMLAIEQTYTIRAEDRKDGNSPLQPFFSGMDRKYWSANKLRSTETLGYTYPELANNPSLSSVKAAINKLYGSSAGSGGLAKRTVIPPVDRRAPATDTAETGDIVAEEVVDGRYRQYMANILVQKFALNSSFAIYVFMGDFDDSPEAWALSPNLVGTHAVFAGITGAVATVNGAKVRMQQKKPVIQVTGTMPLASMLVKKVEAGELEDMSPDVVEDYLEKHLKWRISLVCCS